MENRSRIVGAGVLTAIAASLCCITPVLALVSGVFGVASLFAWMEPLRPFLVAFTVLVLAFAWYQKLKARKPQEVQCDCKEDGKPPFTQSRAFLALVTVFALTMLAFPHFAHVFYPEKEMQEAVYDPAQLHAVTFDVSGMTCNGCASHVEHEVSRLSGVAHVEASYGDRSATVRFDTTAVILAQIEAAINATGYLAEGIRSEND
jgi:mercuric ion transport protein